MKFRKFLAFLILLFIEIKGFLRYETNSILGRTAFSSIRNKKLSPEQQDYLANNLPHRPPLEGRIRSGSDVALGEKPYQLYLSTNNEVVKCGATLAEVYGVQFAITAAHCTWLGYPNQKSTINPASLIVTAGEVNINALTPKTRTRVRSIVPHEDYDPSFWDNDLALLFFEYDFPENQYISPIPNLPAHNSELPSIVEISGWGRNHPRGKPNGILKKVRVPVMDEHLCFQYNQYGKEYLNDYRFCTGIPGEESAGPCKEDGGGPVVTIDREPTLVGVVTTGFSNTYLCGSKNFPAVVLRLSKYMDWIRTKVSDHFQYYNR